jgi:hypothetical protein
MWVVSYILGAFWDCRVHTLDVGLVLGSVLAGSGADMDLNFKPQA